MDESKERKIGAILSYVSIIVNTIIQLIYTPLLVRKLGQSEFGLYSLVASIIGYLAIMDLGFGNAIIVYTSKYRVQGRKQDEKVFHGMFNLIFKIIAVVAFLLGLILYLNVDNIFGAKMTLLELSKMKVMMLILSFNLFITFYFAIYNSIIIAYERFRFQKIMTIIHSVLTPLLMTPLLFLGCKSISLCIVITITNFLTLFSNYYFCKKKLNIKANYLGFDRSLFKVVFFYSFWIFLNIIVDKANWSIDNIILGTISGTISVSIYSIAATFNQVFIGLSTAISSVLLPKITKLITNKVSSDILTEEMIKIGRLQNYVIFLICSAFVLFGKQFIKIWAGIQFTESYYVALLLVIPLSIPLIQNTGLSIMQAMNKYKFRSIMTAIMAVFNIIISIFLARIFGAIGAAIGTCLSLIVCNIIIINIYYQKIIKLNILSFWKSIIRQSLPFIFPITIIVIIMNIFELSGLSALFIYGGLYLLLYIFVAYLLSMNIYEKELIKKFFLKMHIRRV